jgi:hypothetical protein
MRQDPDSAASRSGRTASHAPLGCKHRRRKRQSPLGERDWCSWCNAAATPRLPDLRRSGTPRNSLLASAFTQTGNSHATCRGAIRLLHPARSSSAAKPRFRLVTSISAGASSALLGAETAHLANDCFAIWTVSERTPPSATFRGFGQDPDLATSGSVVSAGRRALHSLGRDTAHARRRHGVLIVPVSAKSVRTPCARRGSTRRR